MRIKILDLIIFAEKHPTRLFCKNMSLIGVSPLFITQLKTFVAV